MKRSATLLVTGLLLLAGGAWAASAGPYDLSWWTVDVGGGSSQGGSYALAGTIGQHDAGALAGGGYTLGGGFWRGEEVVASRDLVYLPLVVR
jgi:hypothetical protein